MLHAQTFPEIPQAEIIKGIWEVRRGSVIVKMRMYTHKVVYNLLLAYFFGQKISWYKTNLESVFMSFVLIHFAAFFFLFVKTSEPDGGVLPLICFIDFRCKELWSSPSNKRTKSLQEIWFIKGLIWKLHGITCTIFHIKFMLFLGCFPQHNFHSYIIHELGNSSAQLYSKKNKAA